MLPAEMVGMTDTLVRFLLLALLGGMVLLVLGLATMLWVEVCRAWRKR